MRERNLAEARIGGDPNPYEAPEARVVLGRRAGVRRWGLVFLLGILGAFTGAKLAGVAMGAYLSRGRRIHGVVDRGNWVAWATTWGAIVGGAVFGAAGEGIRRDGGPAGPDADAPPR